MLVLCGDIGGTKTRLGICETDGVRVRIQEQVDFASADYPALENTAQEFLGSAAHGCKSACFAVAGPVQGQRCETTNLPWLVDAEALTSALGIDRVRLLNDLEATAWGISALDPSDLFSLHPGKADPQGNVSVIAAGTGLGEAGLYWDGERYRPFASEGGHCDFAPSDDREFALQQYLAQRFGHVSWERVVSGMGILNIHSFLSEFRGRTVPDWLQAEMDEADPAAAIFHAAVAGTCPVCRETLELFLDLYGREAGNQALKIMATGGVFLGGGIAPKILDLLRGPTFLNGFLAKGRMEPLMRRIPVTVILEDRAALVGTALRMAASD